MQGLLEAVAIDKGEIPLSGKEDMPAPTLIASERGKRTYSGSYQVAKKKKYFKIS